MNINMNQLAVKICEREGKKKELDIAQVKEVLKVLTELFSEEVVKGKWPNNGFMQMFIDKILDISVRKANKPKPKYKEPRVRLSTGYKS